MELSKNHKHIWYNTNLIQSIDGEYPPGWYFSDETEQLNGPYKTEKEAVESLERYCKILWGEL